MIKGLSWTSHNSLQREATYTCGQTWKYTIEKLIFHTSIKKLGAFLYSKSFYFAGSSCTYLKLNPDISYLSIPRANFSTLDNSKQTIITLTYELSGFYTVYINKIIQKLNPANYVPCLNYAKWPKRAYFSVKAYYSFNFSPQIDNIIYEDRHTTIAGVHSVLFE